MAGVKGRSGGVRIGAGKKPAKPLGDVATGTPLAFLEEVMRDAEAAPALRVKAAIAAAQYRHIKLADGGKGAEKTRKAADVAGERKFASDAPPLKLVG